MRQGLLGHYAGFVSRAIAILIDIVFISVSSSLVIWTIATAWSLLQLSAISRFFGLTPGTMLLDPGVAGGIVVTSMFAMYNIFFWVTTGWTPGKAFMGLRVVTVDGKRLSLPRAIVRLVAYTMSTLPLFLGFFWAIIDNRRQGWHDKLAGTCVIYVWAARHEERFLASQLQQFAPPQQEHKRR